ncbi:RagB/SusD family nutrient uptake outer membrane protein [Autumnicola musiva]|uniref:RagB/SusD family nutrient uptake outer membrane protein n=1 Tax=Autumnicola musiva TaxID=3075589 RepID=A0ABU3DAD2_9FLAO|nr:RagB/SusD family nutrient uptake outer membrane protein [Zunongwangia sp. F117]MDT0678502.1 RagB/SusD family nutrient uptake outer membrane protein [Zunongwangia sp. F117]
MKNKLIILFIAIVGFISCEDPLDKEPLDIISDAQVWNDEDLVDSYLTHLYSVTNFNDVFGDFQYKNVVVTDEARTCFGWSSLLNVFTLGVINPDNIANRDYLGYWEYNIIRGYNEFLMQINNSNLSPEFVENRSAEVRFLRAFHYYNLAMRYGGVPLITEPQEVDDQNLFVSRNTELEIYKFILEELNEIIEVLPEEYNAENYARVSKYAALALKSRAMLYAGSIAKNGSMQLDGILGVPSSEASRFYEESYNASKEIVESGRFALFNRYPNDKVQNYQSLFLEENNSEVIFVKKYVGEDYGHDYDYYNQPLSYKPFVASVINPTLEMVDSYEFIDGSPGSSINYDQEISTLELYRDKDPRFHASILYNEAPWIDSEIETFYFSIDSDISSDPRDNSLSGRGKDVNTDPYAGATQTGFFVKKYLQPERGIPLGGYSDTDFIVFRLGEIYLNLGEASYELNRPAEAQEAINMIRGRAGMPLHTSIDSEKIRHERKIELAFEGIRFWDVRRWRTAEEKLSGVFHKLTAYYIRSRDTYGYLIQNAQGDRVRSFMKDHYYMPLQRSHITENPNLVQNPGYN